MATLERMPISTMMNVIRPRGDERTSSRMIDPINPDSSASPTPSIATRMMPTTPKLLKLATGDVIMKRMPSAVRRPLTAVVSVSMWYPSTSSGRETCGTSTELPDG